MQAAQPYRTTPHAGHGHRLAAAAWILLAACAPVPPPAPPAPEPVPANDLSLEAAVKRVANDFAVQLRPTARSAVLDPTLFKSTASQNAATMRVDGALPTALSAVVGQLTVLPFDSAGTASAQFVITATVAQGAEPDSYLLAASITDRRSMVVIAQSAARFVEPGLDLTPTPSYRARPTTGIDRVREGLIRTAEAEVGKAADELYVSQIETSSLITQGRRAFDDGRLNDALAAFIAASRRPDGARQADTFEGLYYTHQGLGNAREAEDAFGVVATMGIAQGSLELMILFNPGSGTEFWPGASFGAVYPMWIRQIARAMQASEGCLEIVGHTSTTGTDAVNDRLSTERAQTVRRMLERAAPALGRRLTARGVGSRAARFQATVDNAANATDRRVEFKVIECPSGRGGA